MNYYIYNQSSVFLTVPLLLIGTDGKTSYFPHKIFNVDLFKKGSTELYC